MSAPGQDHAPVGERDGALAGLKVAIVEDDRELADILVAELRQEGALAFGLESAEALYRHLLGNPCDAVILDVSLPGEDGYKAAQYLRQIAPQLGIVMLTGRAAVNDMALGLRQGADVYLLKPHDHALMVAALQSVMRRVQRDPPPDRSDWRLSKDGWTLHGPDRRGLALTEQERGLLTALFADRGQPVDREVLIASLTEHPLDFDPHRLEVLVHRLRSRVSSTLDQPLPLRAVRGQGYMLSKQ